MSAGADLGKDNWAGYRPVLDLARHPNIMYASLPEGSGESGAALANLGTSLPAAAAVLLGQAPDADAANKTVRALLRVSPDPRRCCTCRMKISDVHNRSNEAYPHADMKECVQLAVGAFGKERVMWGTGYPDTAHRVASGARHRICCRAGCCFAASSG